MPQSFRKSLTACEAWPADPPTPSTNSRPLRSRSAASPVGDAVDRAEIERPQDLDGLGHITTCVLIHATTLLRVLHTPCSPYPCPGRRGRTRVVAMIVPCSSSVEHEQLRTGDRRGQAGDREVVLDRVRRARARGRS